MLFWLGALSAAGFLLPERGFGLAAFALALGSVTAGLFASTFHLGRPERAWRALSQWRSSWLSREGVAALATYVPTGAFAAGFVFLNETGGIWRIPALLTAIGAVATVLCTGYIYRSLKPVQRWHNGWVVPNYFALGLMAGFLLLDVVIRFWALWPIGTPILTLLSIAVAWALKETYWRFIDTTSAPSTVASATALGSRGRVRLLEPPHTQDNFLLQEMGYRIARKHRVRLRAIVRLAAFALPLGLTLVALFAAGSAGIFAAVLAVISMALGLVIERWLFFAEAKHTVTLYYGAEAA